jgi:hypothetical protein
MSTRISLLLLASIVGASMLGCQKFRDTPKSAPVVQRDTIGDTIVVRTVSGSVWGDSVRLVEELRLGKADGPPEYIFGQMGPMALAGDGTVYLTDWWKGWLRAYDSTGKFVREIGRNGKGPGEFQQVEGIVVQRNGNLVVNDGKNGRLVVFSSTGTPLATWPGKGAYAGYWFRRTALQMDSAGAIYVYKIVTEDDGGDTYGYVRVDSAGKILDSLRHPSWPIVNQLYAPRVYTAIHPAGYLVSGISSTYAIYLFPQGKSAIRIERASAGSVDFTSEEKIELADDNRASRTSIAANKPPFQNIAVSTDGRILVHVPIPSTKRPGSKTKADPRPLWREPYEAWDAFEADGTYLGQLSLPPDARLEMMQGGKVWGTVLDKDGAMYVVRWRIEHK